MLKLLPGLFMTPAATSLVATPPHAHALQDLSAGEIAARIAARELSSAEVVEHFIARLKAVNGKLNAVTVDLSESARKAAADIDKALARGEKLPPLAGLPVTIKECFDLAGTASTFGLTTRRGEIESKDDPYVAALRAAGAIPIAKTNVPQLMIYTETDNPLYGRTNNPWDLERSCGGIERRRSGRHRRRRFAARPRQRHRRLVAHSRGFLRNHFDPADRRPHARSLRPRPAGWPDRDRQPGRADGATRGRLDHRDCASSIACAIRTSFPEPELGDPAAVDHEPACALRVSPMTANFRSRRRCAVRSREAAGC